MSEDVYSGADVFADVLHLYVRFTVETVAGWSAGKQTWASAACADGDGDDGKPNSK